MNKHNLIIALIVGILAIFASSCGHKHEKSGDVLSEEKMRSVMIDLYLFDGGACMKQIPVGDTTRVPYYTAILKKHGITLAQYDSSMVWYGKHVSILQKIHQQVLDSLTERSVELEKK